jgi:hypothetical protein
LGGNIYYFWGLKEPKISSFFPGKFFGKIKNGQKKCPKTDFAKTLSPKYMFCEHN